MISKSIKIILLNLLFFTTLFSNTLQEDMKPFTKSSFKTKQKVVENIVLNHSENEKLTFVLNTLLKGKFIFYKV